MRAVEQYTDHQRVIANTFIAEAREQQHRRQQSPSGAVVEDLNARWLGMHVSRLLVAMTRGRRILPI